MKLLIFTFFSLLLSMSCSHIKEYTTVLSANSAYQEGSYQKANYLYLKILENSQYHHHISYNLGNVYHDLGYMDAALEQWAKINNSTDEELRFRTLFNKGVLYYGRGDYQVAFEQFRRAILLAETTGFRGDLTAVKRNLEICLQKLSMEITTHNSTSTRANNSSTKTVRTSESTQELFKFVRDRERINWSRYIDENAVVGDDY